MDFRLTDKQKTLFEPASRISGHRSAPTAIDLGLRSCRRPRPKEDGHVGAAKITSDGTHYIRALNIAGTQTGIAVFGN